MEQNTRVFQNPYSDPGQFQGYSPQDWDGHPGLDDPSQGYDPALYGQQPDLLPGEEGYTPEYDGEYDPDYDGDEEAYGEFQDEDYSVYQDERDNTHRFHLAMNVFDTASVLAGIVVIFALSAIIFSLISWVRTDITHSFVILQNRIQ